MKRIITLLTINACLAPTVFGMMPEKPKKPEHVPYFASSVDNMIAYAEQEHWANETYNEELKQWEAQIKEIRRQQYPQKMDRLLTTDPKDIVVLKQLEEGLERVLDFTTEQKEQIQKALISIIDSIEIDEKEKNIHIALDKIEFPFPACPSVRLAEKIHHLFHAKPEKVEIINDTGTSNYTPEDKAQIIKSLLNSIDAIEVSDGNNPTKLYLTDLKGLMFGRPPIRVIDKTSAPKQTVHRPAPLDDHPGKGELDLRWEFAKISRFKNRPAEQLKIIGMPDATIKEKGTLKKAFLAAIQAVSFEYSDTDDTDPTVCLDIQKLVALLQTARDPHKTQQDNNNNDNNLAAWPDWFVHAAELNL